MTQHPRVHFKSNPGLGLGGRGLGRHPRDGRVKHVHPADAALTDYSQPKEQAWQRDGRIMAELTRQLASLPGPTATRALASAIADALELEPARVAEFIQGVAPALPEAQRDHASAFLNARGDPCVPWLWYPTKGAKAKFTPDDFTVTRKPAIDVLTDDEYEAAKRALSEDL